MEDEMIYGMKSLLLSPGESGSTLPAGDPPETSSDSKASTDAGDTGRDGAARKEGEGSAAKVAGDDPRLKKARDESIAERKKRQELEARIETMEADNQERNKNIARALGLADDDDPAEAAANAKSALEAMTKKAETALVRNAVTIEAAKLGAIDPDAVFKLGDFSEAKVDLDKGTVLGVTEIVKSLLDEKPYLKAKPAATPSGGTPPASDPHTDEVGKEEIKKKMEAAKAGDHAALIWVSKNLKAIKEAGLG
jgi:hypothetical protein